jgi:hypothetical protein
MGCTARQTRQLGRSLSAFGKLGFWLIIDFNFGAFVDADADDQRIEETAY